MTLEQFLNQINKVIKTKFPDEEDIISVQNAREIHSKLIECRVDLMLKHGIHTMPHYRGEQNFGWDILPGIFRPPFYNGFDNKKGKELEEKGIELFENKIVDEYGKDSLIESNKKLKNGKKWDLLMQAQHAGVKTNLTDWSDFILAATFFSTEYNEQFEDNDGQLWAFLVPTDWILGYDNSNSSPSFYDFDPFKLRYNFMVNPANLLDDIHKRLFEYRFFKQGGRFFSAANEICHLGLNNMPDLKKLLIRFRIPAELKKEIRNELTAMKITRANYYIEETDKARDLIDSVNQELAELR